MINKKRHLLAVLLTLSVTTVSGQEQVYQFSRVLPVPDMGFYGGVMTGLDVLEELNLEPLAGRTLAVLTNQTAVNRNGVHLLDLLMKGRSDLKVKIVYTPEFGFVFNGTESMTVSHEGKDGGIDTGVKTLWGRDFSPDIDDLRDVDMILVDLQDPGVRFFSFMTTVTKVMEAASLKDIPVVVLDRPNPLNGLNIDGPNVRPPFQSFVGYHLVPVRHGLTIGEYTLMVNETGWIRNGKRARLTVVPMVNWERHMWMDETGLPWVSPAPQTVNLETLLLAAGVGLFEGTNVSFGLGTSMPYLQFGSPWMSAELILKSLEKKHLPGVRFSPVTFTPDSLSRLISNPLYRGERCSGIRMTVTDRRRLSPLLTAVTILGLISRHHPGHFQWVENNYVDKLYGHDYLRIFLAQERDTSRLPATWSRDVIQFSDFRKPFLLY